MSSTYVENHVNTRAVDVRAVFIVKVRTIANSSFNLCTKLLTEAAIEPIYEVVNRQKGIIARDPEFTSQPFQDHPDCASYQSLIRDGNYALGKNRGQQCTNCEKLWQQG